MDNSAQQSASKVIETPFSVEDHLKNLPLWARSVGESNGIVFSTRIRLARNLSGVPFPSAAKKEELTSVVNEIVAACKDLPMLEDAYFVKLKSLGSSERKALVERRLISPLFADTDAESMLICDRDEQYSLMVNEEDHLRLQSVQAGLSFDEGWRLISRIDEELSESIDYAFSDRFGYLTACPTNTGTGLRASILIHLPALSYLNDVEHSIKEMAPSEISVRGFYGEGTDVIGNIYQISNQLTLGRSEAELLSRLELVAHRFMELERKARERVLESHRLQLEDKVYRALGILQNARMLSSTELIDRLSIIRLGVDLELLEKIDRATLSEMMIFTLPAHLQLLYGGDNEPEARDALRANIIREKIKI